MTNSPKQQNTDLVIVIAWVILLSSVAFSQQSNIALSSPPLGKLVDIGGWRIHINCTGDSQAKSTTVVLESGSGGFSFDWSLIQPGVARFARVCSYDRAGSAWSDLGPRPRTMRQIAYELHTALNKAGIREPYVMVGHSIGGLLVRTYAAQYPKEVAGMVLVDSTHEDNKGFTLDGKLQSIRERSTGRLVPAIQTSISKQEKELLPEERQKIEQFRKMIGPPTIRPPFDKLPTSLQQTRLWALSLPSNGVADSDPYRGEEFSEIYVGRQKQQHPLGAMPLIVLSSGLVANPRTDQDKLLIEDGQRLQADLKNLSTNSKQVIAEKSGHHVQFDQPELVIDSIKGVVDAVRTNSHIDAVAN